MTKKTALLLVPLAVAVIVTLVPQERLVSVAVAAVAATTIGVVLALQSRSRPRAPGGSWVFEVLQSTPLDGAGRLVAVRFGGRVLLVAADRNGGRLLAEAVAEDEPVVELPRAAPHSVPALDPVAEEHVSAYRSLARSAAAEIES